MLCRAVLSAAGTAPASVRISARISARTAARTAGLTADSVQPVFKLANQRSQTFILRFGGGHIRLLRNPFQLSADTVKLRLKRRCRRRVKRTVRRIANLQKALRHKRLRILYHT